MAVVGSMARFGLGMAVFSNGHSNPERCWMLPMQDPSANAIWAKRTEITKVGNNNATSDITDSKGDDIWDGEISNEDMSDILHDKFGLLAITLGVLAVTLLFLIILTLGLAYKMEKDYEKAYKELYGAD
ncbi:hypothetical protein FRC10_004895 [Ceratobasidium sp. 414]|nr:hypothetical protein FRC10_004895 [Ceratobasidium sp. 414]